METFVGGMLAVPSRRCQIGDLLFPLLAKWNPNRWMAKGREKKTKGEGRVKEKTKNFLLQSLRQFRISSKKSAFRPVSLWWVNEIVVIQSSFQAEWDAKLKHNFNIKRIQWLVRLTVRTRHEAPALLWWRTRMSEQGQLPRTNSALNYITT